MADLKLHGLTANSAHGYLAALGVVDSLRQSGLPARLSWSSDFYPAAILSGVDGPDQLVEALLEDRDRRLVGAVLRYPPDKPFETLGCDPDSLRNWAEYVGELSDDDPDLDLWSALVIEGGFTAEGKAKPTHFDFTAGQMKFLRLVRDIAAALNADVLTEALFGPWRFESDLSTLKFEREGERMQALRGVPPKDDKLKGVPGADWLAFRGLSFYPLSLVQGRDRPRVVTPACDRDLRRSAFRWVVWSEILDRWTIAALVTDPRLVGESTDQRVHDPDSLTAWGVRSVWQSSIARANRYGAFGPAKQIARSS